MEDCKLCSSPQVRKRFNRIMYQCPMCARMPKNTPDTILTLYIKDQEIVQIEEMPCGLTAKEYLDKSNTEWEYYIRIGIKMYSDPYAYGCLNPDYNHPPERQKWIQDVKDEWEETIKTHPEFDLQLPPTWIQVYLRTLEAKQYPKIDKSKFGRLEKGKITYQT